MPFCVMAPAASLALRRASSSRMRLESSTVLPVMNCGRPPGWVTLSSMRVRGWSSKCSSGRPAADGGELVAPALPLRFGDVRRTIPRITCRDGVRSGHLGRREVRRRRKRIVVCLSVEAPHTDTLNRYERIPSEAGRVFVRPALSGTCSGCADVPRLRSLGAPDHDVVGDDGVALEVMAGHDPGRWLRCASGCRPGRRH